MLLDVPFIPDTEYAAFLCDRAQSLTSVHFSLAEPSLSDARQRLHRQDMNEVIHGLRRLHNVDKYVLMNARLHAPGRYFDTEGLAKTAQCLERLSDEADLKGVIFADPYFLQAVSDARPELACRLEAMPSINTMPDTADKAFALLAMIGNTGFRLPSRLIPDRSLNRNIDRLDSFTDQIRTRYPRMQFLLMANEGCLYQCPYKPAHDAHVALVNEGLCPDRTFAMNRDFGCVRRLLVDTGAMLASPFIRPEDLHEYLGRADGIKLCGRNRGSRFLMRAVTAYLDGTYAGNLLDLMDAMGDLNDRVNIPNPALPDTFFRQVTTCDKDCLSCGRCAGLMDRIAMRTDPGLSRMGV
jgi:collagenase-like PrtC family protease